MKARVRESEKLYLGNWNQTADRQTK